MVCVLGLFACFCFQKSELESKFEFCHLSSHFHFCAFHSSMFLIGLSAPCWHYSCFRQILDTEDELQEIKSDAVPSEVRDWLASTFTQQTRAKGRRSEEKPKFRSIVHAVQAGIFVERFGNLPLFPLDCWGLVWHAGLQVDSWGMSVVLPLPNLHYQSSQVLAVKKPVFITSPLPTKMDLRDLRASA